MTRCRDDHTHGTAEPPRTTEEIRMLRNAQDHTHDNSVEQPNGAHLKSRPSLSFCHSTQKDDGDAKAVDDLQAVSVSTVPQMVERRDEEQRTPRRDAI